MHVGAITLALATAVVAHPAAAQTSDLKGAIKIDGSSTVYPITEAVAEEFAEVAGNVRVTVGISGTGGGFKRFTIGETDISDASRPIKKEEHDKTTTSGVKYLELPVAYDGLSIVVNKENTWVDRLTVEDLKRIFLDGSTVHSWQDVKAGWPDVPVKIYAPGTDSGTFDYFKEVVAGKDAIRGDMSVSEDDNVLVRGVAGDHGAIGFFGCAYYFENQERLRVVPIVNPHSGQAVTPSPKAIETGEYAPFSRPLFIYVNAASIERPEVAAFVDFYLAKGPELAAEVGYVSLPAELYGRARANVKARKTGSQFLQGNAHRPLAEIYH